MIYNILPKGLITMTSRQIECFLVAADKLNFTTASEILFLSQSNMSRNISSLEEELGMKLFERQKNKVLLTEQGLIMYEAFSQMNKYISSRVALAKNGSNTEEGKLTFGFLYYMDLDSFITDYLNHFREKHPRIEVELISLPVKPLAHILESGEADIIISHDFSSNSTNNIFSYELGTSPLYCVYSDNHPLAHKKNLSITDFQNQKFYLSETIASTDITHMVHKFAAYYHLDNYKIKSVSYDTSLLNVGLGNGITVTDKISCQKIPNTFHLLELDSTQFYTTIMMNWSKNNFNPAITSFIKDTLDIQN